MHFELVHVGLKACLEFASPLALLDPNSVTLWAPVVHPIILIVKYFDAV